MNTIEVRAAIDAPPSAVWALLGDFGGVASWNPFVESAEISGSGVGMSRTITAGGGARIVERLESVADEERHLRYAVQLENGATSTADIRLEEGDDGATVVIWRSIREADIGQEQKDAMAATLQTRIDALSKAVRLGDVHHS